MAYSNVDDIKKFLPEDALVQLTDDEGLGSVNQARVEEAINQADAEINSYIGGRYGVPLSAVPDAVRKLSVDIAVYNLYSRTVQELPEARKERYRNAVRQLEGMSKGLVSLGVNLAPSVQADAVGAETSTETDGRVFDRDKLKGF